MIEKQEVFLVIVHSFDSPQPLTSTHCTFTLISPWSWSFSCSYRKSNTRDNGPREGWLLSAGGTNQKLFTYLNPSPTTGLITPCRIRRYRGTGLTALTTGDLILRRNRQRPNIGHGWSDTWRDYSSSPALSSLHPGETSSTATKDPSPNLPYDRNSKSIVEHMSLLKQNKNKNSLV